MNKLLPFGFDPLIAIFLFLSLLGVPGMNEAVGMDLQAGIEGHYRVGHWTAVQSPETAFDSIETRDGDGVEVRYGKPDPLGQWGYVIPGSEAAPLMLRLDNEVVASTRFPTIGSPSRGPAMIPLETPWIVALGDPLGVDQIGYNEILGRDAVLAVSIPKNPQGLPDSVLGYDGVDLMMIGGSGIDLLRELKPNQQQAISTWISEGGRLFLTLGDSASELFSVAPWLKDLLPLQELVTANIDPSAFETFMSSQSRLEPFRGLQLPSNKGRVLLMGRTTRRVSLPVAVEYNVGFGRITAVAADLESDIFAEWPNRLEMIVRLTGSTLKPEQETVSRKVRSTAFDDLAGQLRSTLDQFQIQRNLGFSFVSLILMALIAIIGPLDYLLINRVLGRPLLGWLSFPIATIGLSIMLILQARPIESAPAATTTTSTAATTSNETVRCNRIEIFDIDSVQGIGRGFTASYLYSQEASRFDVQVDPTPTLMSLTDNVEEILSVPFGYPGAPFGGIQIAVEDSRLPVYSLVLNEGSSSDSSLSSVLQGMPLASRSSKGLSTRCRFRPQLIETSLEHRPGSELLQGELVNPLPFDLLDGMLIYRNWAYLLPTRFPAGGRIDSVDSLRQKNFRWQLTRQRALESASESEAWDPTNTTSTSRVAEMLMFHDAVGGDRYTSLNHGPLGFLDFTHVLASDRCILLGRVKKPLTKFQIQDTKEAAFDAPQGERLSLMRVVLPVIDAETN
ncbi:MAG: hypothetical protein P1U77_05370 [Rubripirellula sp.]|nr:hypothetical protein [Rubripirellula sp.]